ncbi:sensor histidine kinase [Chloroflexus sp.]|uniref:sensor histidine kinase n=1 Tax=Chloroflexus sp. TaxID=1904827 RepID=UPI003D151346
MIERDDAIAHIAKLERELQTAHSRIAALEREVALHMQHTRDLNRRLEVLLSVSAALLITHDTDTIVTIVAQRAIELFPGTATTYIYLFEHEPEERLQLRVSVPEHSPSLPVSILAEMGAKVPRALLLNGPELEYLLHQQQPEATLVRDSRQWPQSVLLAPLRIERQRMGVLIVCSEQLSHLYHPRDLPFVQALADLTVIAIDEIQQRQRAAALQHDLALTQSLRAEAEARLNAAQAQLLQSAKLAAVGELSASVAHEINNPLYAARNSLYLVEQDLPPDAPQRTFLTIAQQELSRIARIITRMRDFYRPSRGELTNANINALLRETLELVTTHLRHSHVTIHTQLASDLPPIVAHADQLRQVFLNIILNACDAMPGGGTLTVRSELIATRSEKPMTLAVSISDTGVGIDPEHIPHLFEPFYTTKPHGTGLGLAISAHIITQHGGRITVDSQPGVGTTFTILLPLEPPPTAVAQG